MSKPHKDSIKYGNLGSPVQVSLTACVGPSVGATFFTRKIRMCSAKISKLLMIPLNSTFIKAINWQTLRKNNVSSYVARNVLRQRKLDFGDGFSVVFNNLGARWFDFTLVVSLRDDRLVKKPWRYQSKPLKDSLKCGNLESPMQVSVFSWSFPYARLLVSSKVLRYHNMHV